MSERWTEGNEVELLINGDEFFPRVFDAIRAAKKEVLLETFIFREDEVGNDLQRALIECAKKGVNVELTVDGYGTPDLNINFIRAMTDVGIKLHVFDPRARLLGVRTNIFRRLHRKIVVIDSELAFIGGINFSADHLTNFGPTAKQDYAVQVRGPVVQDIHKACWKLLINGSKNDDAAKINKIAAASSVSESTETNTAVGQARILMAVRDNVKHTNNIERHYLRAIHRAKKRVIIANAYFFPGYRLLWALRRAARRGVTVTLILQGRSDMPWVSLFTSLLYEYFLRNGVIIREYCQRPLHGKVAIVDDSWVTVGSSNLDPLSLALNLEANLIIEDKQLNQTLFDHLTSLIKTHCKPITISLAKRGYWWRMPLVFLSFHFLRHFPFIVGWLPAHMPRLRLMNSETKDSEDFIQEKTSDAEKLSQ
ncbi:MAG TPA: cardiolipin synthase ClsB [Cellvibrionaceae bacterium]